MHHVGCILYKLLKLNEILCANTFEFNLYVESYSHMSVHMLQWNILYPFTNESLFSTMRPMCICIYFAKILRLGMGWINVLSDGLKIHILIMCMVESLNFNFLTHNIGIHVRCFVHSYMATSLRPKYPGYHVSSILNFVPTNPGIYSSKEMYFGIVEANLVLM